MLTTRLRRAAATVTAAALAVVLPTVGAMAVLNIDTTKSQLAAVGPVSGTNQFPVWYEDKVGTRMQLCADDADPMCGFTAASGVPNLAQPLSYTSNWPLEVFYFLAQSTMPINGTGKIVTDLGLEASFSNGFTVIPGDNVVFGRVRHTITGGAANSTYVVFHPYGVDKVVTDGTGKGRFTEDIGLSPGVFTAALSSRIGPFLRWTPDTAAGFDQTKYLGNPGVLHTVTGSPITDAAGQPQNYIKVVGPLTTAPADLSTASGPAVTQNLFAVLGKVAVDRGVTGVGAYFGKDSTGSYLDVYATSDPGQAIQVTGQPTYGFATTAMVGGTAASRNYYARVPLTGTTRPASVQVVNTGDTTVTPVSIPVTDAVTVTKASFDPSAGTLTVNATSSDPAATLTVTGYGALSSGSATFAVGAAAPGTVSVTSSAGGKDSAATATAAGSGTVSPVVTPMVSAGPDQTASAGAPITLSASVIQGDITGWSWSQGATSLGTSKSLTVNAPMTPGTYTYTVTGTPLSGAPVSDSLVLTVTGTTTAAVANAGADVPSATRGGTVLLDGSKSTGVASYSWSIATGSAPGSLLNTNTATPTLNVPLFDASKTANPMAPILVNLTVTSTGGSTSTDQVAVYAAPGDTLGITTATLRTSKSQWRVDGTSTIRSGQIVKAHRDSLTGPVIGQAQVDATGVFQIRVTNTAVGAGSPTTDVYLETTLGGILGPFPVTVSR